MNWKSYLWPQTIARYESKHNGTIKVVESFGKKYLDAGGLMQSGPFLERIWGSAFRKLQLDKKEFGSILILGLGGGSFVGLAKKMFPKATITAVDIDSMIVQIGANHLSLIEQQVAIFIEDAKKFVDRSHKYQLKYDLIFIDLYQGYHLPPFVESKDFLAQVSGLLAQHGSLVFNRLYFREYKQQTDEFVKRLTSLFPKVKSVKSYSNLLVSVQK